MSDPIRSQIIPRTRPAGFTLVELVVLLGVLALLAAAVVPALREKVDDDNLKGCTSVLANFMKASAAYAADNKALLPHGSNSPWVEGEMIGTSSYMQTIFKPNQFCGVGLLMTGNYLPEKREAIACPQADRREDKGYNTGTTGPLLNYTSSEPNDATDVHLFRALRPESGDNYYRNLIKTKHQVSLATTYGIRGPSLKSDAITKLVGKETKSLKPSETAWFVDYEAADQKLVKEVTEGGKKVITAWGRVHPQGLNTAYVDGHVRMFADEDRTRTWAGGQIRYYGTAINVDTFDLEGK